MAEQDTQADVVEEDEVELDRHRADAILDAIEAEDRAALNDLLEPLHAADIADFLEQISTGERRRLLTLWGDGIDGAILSELDESLREEVIAALDPQVLAEAVRELESDDVVDLIEDLDQPQQDAILDALDLSDRVAVEQSLSFPEESAGRLMQPNVVRAPEHWTVGNTIDYLRSAEELPDQFYHVVLVDPRMHPSGYVTLGKLLGAPRGTRMADITEHSFRTISVTTPEEDVAYMFNQYHLISAPVVDDEDRLVGVITIDDAMLVLDAEAGEDMMRLAGVGDESVSDRTFKIARQRFPWLLVNLFTAILASMVIAQFEAAITQVVALAVLMPIVASMGGNAGTQSLTVAVRALATRDLTGSNALRVVAREAMAGMLNGAAFAAIMAVVGIIWFGLPMLGVVIAVAMMLNLVVAALAGVLIPLGLEKVGVDPALASGAFVTTVTDVTGFFAFLGLAVVLLL